MDGDPAECLYRGMEEENGMPRLGANALRLGVRKGRDIPVDQAGMVYRPQFHPGAPNGLSCSPTVDDLPVFALPLEWGGTSPRAVVWKIAVADLGPELVAREDTPPQHRGIHISVGPSGPMTFDEYNSAIEATRPKWIKVPKN